MSPRSPVRQHSSPGELTDGQLWELCADLEPMMNAMGYPQDISYVSHFRSEDHERRAWEANRERVRTYHREEMLGDDPHPVAYLRFDATPEEVEAAGQKPTDRKVYLNDLEDGHE